MKFCSSKFSYKNKTFVAEASDLDRYFNPQHGLTIVSLKTNQPVHYTLVKTAKDNENDVLFWEFVPDLLANSLVPKARGTRVVIYND